jgi:hypothetical protein
MDGVLETLQPGDHAALIYRTRAEQFLTVAPFIKSGLDRHDRCLYIANDNSIPLIFERFFKFGIDVSAAKEKGALVIATKKDTYQKHGIFEPKQMVAHLRAEVEHALTLGFSGLRATGEMTWALDTPEALARLTEYEALLHQQFSSRLTGLCQYDETRFSTSIISDIIRIHPKLIVRGKLVQNPFLERPETVLAGSLPHVSVSDLLVYSE